MTPREEATRRLALIGPRPGTFAALDTVLTDVVAFNRPAWVTTDAVKREVAIHWLRARRPAGFLGRLRWLGHLALELLRSRP